jgi:hypothetical protein
MEENGMARAPHLPYSQDLAPSDFYLFGYVKHWPRGQSFEMTDDFFSASEVILRGNEKPTVDSVFLKWMQRLRQCTPTNGDYFEETQKSIVGESFLFGRW